MRRCTLQMVAGQISSRMDDLSATYATAFPMAASYLKVLRTFRGSPVSERLNLVYYLVRPDGQGAQDGSTRSPRLYRVPCLVRLAWVADDRVRRPRGAGRRST